MVSQGGMDDRVCQGKGRRGAGERGSTASVAKQHVGGGGRGGGGDFRSLFPDAVRPGILTLAEN